MILHKAKGGRKKVCTVQQNAKVTEESVLKGNYDFELPELLTEAVPHTFEWTHSEYIFFISKILVVNLLTGKIRTRTSSPLFLKFIHKPNL